MKDCEGLQKNLAPVICRQRAMRGVKQIIYINIVVYKSIKKSLQAKWVHFILSLELSERKGY